MGVDYLPKVQARKLYQYAQERKESESVKPAACATWKRNVPNQVQCNLKHLQRLLHAFQQAPQPVAASLAPVVEAPPAPAVHEEPVVTAATPKPDELTEKLEES